MKDRRNCWNYPNDVVDDGMGEYDGEYGYDGGEERMQQRQRH